jgi:hypothetical protein
LFDNELVFTKKKEVAAFAGLPFQNFYVRNHQKFISKRGLLFGRIAKKGKIDRVIKSRMCAHDIPKILTFVGTSLPNDVANVRVFCERCKPTPVFFTIF